MTDKQKLVYDLSMQCALWDMLKRKEPVMSVPGDMLKAFTDAVRGYCCMDPNTLESVLSQLEKV